MDLTTLYAETAVFDFMLRNAVLALLILGLAISAFWSPGMIVDCACKPARHTDLVEAVLFMKLLYALLARTRGGFLVGFVVTLTNTDEAMVIRQSVLLSSSA